MLTYKEVLGMIKQAAPMTEADLRRSLGIRNDGKARINGQVVQPRSQPVASPTQQGVPAPAAPAPRPAPAPAATVPQQPSMQVPGNKARKALGMPLQQGNAQQTYDSTPLTSSDYQAVIDDPSASPQMKRQAKELQRYHSFGNRTMRAVEDTALNTGLAISRAPTVASDTVNQALESAVNFARQNFSRGAAPSTGGNVAAPSTGGNVAAPSTGGNVAAQPGYQSSVAHRRRSSRGPLTVNASAPRRRYAFH